MMPTLSAEDQQKFQPFLVRPTEPNSIFAAQPSAIVGNEGMVASDGPSGQCINWADSGTSDTRYKIWACRDQDAAAADQAIATLGTMLNEIWGPMTKPEPDGMGPPLPDGNGPVVSREYGGDARIDFYALNLGQVFFRDRNNSIPVTAAAAAISSPPYTSADGVARNGSSGFIMVNRNRLGETVAMKQDLIHEFFHVLQFAHNVKAPHKGTVSHWFVEASAVWAETFFLRAQSAEPHRWFVTRFQTSTAGLEDADQLHQYGSYVWPFFMEQEKHATAIFKAWAGIDPVGTSDFTGVTNAISVQLPIEANFHVFAVRNLNLRMVLDPSSEKHYRTLDDNFYDDVIPTNFLTGSVSPGAPYVSPSQTIAPLAARYFKLDIAEPARLVTISTSQLSPGGQVDTDAFVHVLGGTWKKRTVSGGMLKFCRDDPGDDIDQVYLVVSNHARDGNVTGVVEASAKDKCSGDKHFGGTINWTTEATVIIDRSPDLPNWERHVTLTGTMQVVLLVHDTGYHYELSAERDGGSTYSYDYSIHETEGDQCDTHETGVLETYVGGPDGFPGDWSYGQLNVIGGLFEDLDLGISIQDWCGAQMGMDVPEELQNAPILGFPLCPEGSGFLTATFDGTSSYLIDCSYQYDNSQPRYTDTGSVHVSGRLQMLDGPHPTPR